MCTEKFKRKKDICIKEMSSLESTFTGTNLWYIAHVRKRFIALEAYIATMEQQAAILESQAILINTQLKTLREELAAEIITSTEEVQIALHEIKHTPKVKKPSVAF